MFVILGKDEVKEENESLKGSAKRKGVVVRDQKLKMRLLIKFCIL